MHVNETISSRLRFFFKDHGQARDFLPYAIAKVIAYQLPIPKTECNFKSFFMREFDYKVGGLISKINEYYFFDIREAMHTTYIIWNTRCQLVYNPDSIDFLTLLKTASSGLISTDAIDRIRSLDKVKGEIKPEIISILETIIIEEISDD